MLIAAKAPLPGHAKTRLCPPLTPMQAARVAEAFLTDVLAAAQAVDPGAAFLCRASDAAVLRERFPGVPQVIQDGTGLSPALATGTRGGAVVVAGDAPGIAPPAIERAASATDDLVLAPSHDGGFSLIRMRRHRPGLLDEIRWSTGSVLEQLVAAARRAGLTVAVLEPIADVDTIGDLAFADLAAAPATRAALAACGAVRTHLPAAGWD